MLISRRLHNPLLPIDPPKSNQCFSTGGVTSTSNALFCEAQQLPGSTKKKNRLPLLKISRLDYPRTESMLWRRGNVHRPPGTTRCAYIKGVRRLANVSLLALCRPFRTASFDPFAGENRLEPPTRNFLKVYQACHV